MSFDKILDLTVGVYLFLYYCSKTQRRGRQRRIGTRGTNSQHDHSTRTGGGDVAPLMVGPVPFYFK